MNILKAIKISFLLAVLFLTSCGQESPSGKKQPVGVANTSPIPSAKKEDIPAFARELVESLTGKPSREQKWVMLPSGVSYVDINEGKDKSKPVEKGVAVFMNCRGYLEDGKVFMDTYKNQADNRIFRFHYGAGEVIPGLEEGIKSMREGGKRIFVVPPSLAFGDKGMDVSDAPIPPGATLIYEATLMWLKKPELDKIHMFR